MRQRGTKFHPGEFRSPFALFVGEGVGMGRDHTLYALTEGYVHFTWNPFNKKQVGCVNEVLILDDRYYREADAYDAYHRPSQCSKTDLGLNQPFSSSDTFIHTFIHLVSCFPQTLQNPIITPLITPHPNTNSPNNQNTPNTPNTPTIPIPPPPPPPYSSPASPSPPPRSPARDTRE